MTCTSFVASEPELKTTDGTSPLKEETAVNAMEAGARSVSKAHQVVLEVG